VLGLLSLSRFSARVYSHAQIDKKSDLCAYAWRALHQSIRQSRQSASARDPTGPEILRQMQGSVFSRFRPRPFATRHRQSLGARLPQARFHPPHAAKALQSNIMFPDRVLGGSPRGGPNSQLFLSGQLRPLLCAPKKEFAILFFVCASCVPLTLAGVF
jgi:hypothetical protein